MMGSPEKVRQSLCHRERGRQRERQRERERNGERTRGGWGGEE